MSRSLRSTLITSASPLLRTGPPARAATVLNTSRFQPLSALPLAPDTTNPCQGQFPRPPSHVPYGSRRPDSRRLHAGHHLANKRAPARLIPGSHWHPGFDAISYISTLHQRFTRVRLPGPYL